MEDFTMEDLQEMVIALEAYIKLLKKQKNTKENIEIQKERLRKIKLDIQNNNFEY